MNVAIANKEAVRPSVRVGVRVRATVRVEYMK
jgi:hypothetical protein